jgi:hypothetical protein
MDDQDIERLRERLEEILEQDITVDQAKKVAVFVKMFVSMGADFGRPEDLRTIGIDRAKTASCVSSVQMIKPSEAIDFIPDFDEYKRELKKALQIIKKKSS